MSDLRVTFSVARTVRLATSLRISSSERRVSAWMSRRAAAISSSRCWVAWTFESSWSDSAALRARDTMSSACSRASLSRARYSSSSSSASTFVRWADSIESSIALRRRSSASAMRGNATLLRTYSVTRNAISVQIITPSEIEMSGLLSASGIRVGSSTPA